MKAAAEMVTNLSPLCDQFRCPLPGSTQPVGNELFRPPPWISIIISNMDYST